ncbi:mitochondrial carrier [Dothidotthia symphoricarpi CBS 119687]|uniref:Mitochondrial thiamine pyrophosphate carrier 1 n=1 Tax=Dothidotthia symphoricarpi CBS 119687 TaxID=1392245 RepID=A0A6A6AN52_9PLEO|nr:mitochondrial carrier [Dothidotthia symphoricarpi CBS 119687]KAF2132485.1 mitochondrial carrier [Dothidotthia symphoricarpi CBS 119687]
MTYIIRSGFAGGIAGCVAKTSVAPLDRVRILFQTSNPQFTKYTKSWVGFAQALRDIYGRDGMKGIFRGHSATLLKIYPYAAINFVAHEQYRALIICSKSQETWIRRFSAGASAGVTSVFLLYPLDIIRVRLAFETKSRTSSLVEICRRIYHEQLLSNSAPVVSGSTSGVIKDVALAATPRTGVINFYRGFSMTILGMVPYAGMSFMTHDVVGDLLRQPSVQKYTILAQPANAPSDKPAPLRAWAELTSGGVSGAVSQTVSYPLEVIRRRMQVGGAVGDGHRLGIGETAGVIFKERGISGFFVGLYIGYVKVVPMVAISFYTYERMKSFLGI